MATQWVKSLQCKSRAVNDVVHHHHHQTHKHRPVPAPVSSTCRKGVQDVIETTKPEKPRRKPKQPGSRDPEPGSNQKQTQFLTITLAPFFPALTELPVGHPSRNVVEIIFRSSWSPEQPFSGPVEMVFKIRNPLKTVARFEEYREKLKSGITAISGGGEEHARCAADGNEVMGFHGLGPTDRGLGYDVTTWDSHGGGKGGGGGMCVFSGGGGAHESGGGGGKGRRRAMLVCRVVAGRVCKQIGLESMLEGGVGFESVSGYNGELLVFDSRAVLPCFLIIYKL